MRRDPAVLQDLTLFVEVARARGFGQGARRLGLSAATASRRVAALEAKLGVRLLNRTTRRVEPTGEGLRLLERCGPIVDEAHAAAVALRSDAERPAGRVRVSMPVDLGVGFVGPMLPAFARRYPEVTLALDLSPGQADLQAGDCDVALRLIASRDRTLVSRRIGWLTQGLYAAPFYLERQGAPAAPVDLPEHECILIGTRQQRVDWTFRRGSSTVTVTVKGRFAANNQGLTRGLTEAGMGIAVLDPSLSRAAIQAGRLVPLLTAWELPRLPVYAVTTSRLNSSAVRAFVEFVVAGFPDHLA